MQLPRRQARTSRSALAAKWKPRNLVFTNVVSFVSSAQPLLLQRAYGSALSTTSPSERTTARKSSFTVSSRFELEYLVPCTNYKTHLVFKEKVTFRASRITASSSGRRRSLWETIHPLMTSMMTSTKCKSLTPTVMISSFPSYCINPRRYISPAQAIPQP
jgi:hypothetical protein